MIIALQHVLYQQSDLRPLAVTPGLGSLSPDVGSGSGGETSCLTPGFRFSRANGQSNPSVDSISITGAGGKVFSSALRGKEMEKS